MIRLPAASAAAQDAAAAAVGQHWVDWARDHLEIAQEFDDDEAQRAAGVAAAEARFVADHDPDSLLAGR